MGIRGGQIRDETIESVDLASGSIKAAEADEQLISGQPTLGSADTTNDRLLIWDADGSVSGALKQIAPTNLGIGGSGSPGGSDTQVQFNDGGSFAGNSGLTFNKTSGVFTVDKGAVFNEGSHDSDFRVESNTNANMLVVNAGTDRVGIGTDAPLTTLHVSGAGSTDASITIQGQADAGIRLAADKANVDEGNNPYIDWYQDGQNPTSRNNRVAMIAMEGTAGTAFTGSLANALFIDTFCPNSQQSNVRRFQIATDCSSSADGANHSARLTIEGSHGYVGLHTNAATSPLHVYSDESDNFAALIDNDNSSNAHGLKVTSDGTGNGTNLLDVEAGSTTVFRVRGDGRVGIGKVSSLPDAMLTLSSSNTDSDLAIAHKIHHIGDSDTFITFGVDDVNIQAGGVDFIKITEDDSQDTLTINEGGADVDFRVESSANTHTLFAQGSSGFVGIGTSSPDGILHIDGGTSNTELIIEKDGNTTASIVFDVAGSRRFEISHDANEYLNFNSYAPNQDIFFNHTSDNGGTVRMLHIDGNDDGAVVVGNSVSNDPYSGATFIVTGTMGHGLGTAFFVTQSASVVPGLHIHNARSTADTGIALRFSNHSVNAAATVGYYGEISLENTAGSPSLQNPDMVFKVQDNNTFGAQNMSEAMRIQNGGAVGIGATEGRISSLLHVSSSTEGMGPGGVLLLVEHENNNNILFVTGSGHVGIMNPMPAETHALDVFGGINTTGQLSVTGSLTVVNAADVTDSYTFPSGEGSANQVLTATGLNALTFSTANTLISKVMVIAVTEENTNIQTGTAQVTIRAPFAMAVTAVRGSLSTASSSGAVEFDVNVGGASIFSTRPTIDANETTTTSAATASVLSNVPTMVSDDAQITFDIDSAGTSARGLKVAIYYNLTS